MKIKKITSILILILIIILLILLLDKKENKSIDESKVSIIDSILSHNIEELDKDFLKWIKDNYKEESLNKLHKYLKNNEYNEEIWHSITGNSYIVLKDLYNKKYKNMNNIKIINTKDKYSTINFIGDVSLADNWYIMKEYDKRNKGLEGILSKDVIKELNESTLTIANNEFTVSTRGESTPGKYYTFRGNPERLKIYKDMGVDLVTLANNHVYDYGDVAFNDLIDSLNEYNIPHIGAGKNLNEASTPYYFIVNGYKIAFLNANRSEKLILTPPATNESGGVLRCYDSEYFINLIKETKKESDFIITLLHWGKEDSHQLEQVQIDDSKKYIDAGSDIVIGTHAHVLQGIDFYNNKPIIYNIGDFIFNNEDKDTVIFKLSINKNGEFKYYLIPAHQKDEYTYILKDDEKKRVLNDIKSWSTNININDYGEIIQEK